MSPLVCWHHFTDQWTVNLRWSESALSNQASKQGLLLGSQASKPGLSLGSQAFKQGVSLKLQNKVYHKASN